MKTKVLIALGVAVVLALAIVAVGSAVSGAAFTTFNAHVDGATKDICKNSAINCNIYGAKEYVWLNGGPTANGLGPDGEYFFAVLVPGGQPNPNDGGLKNLSDDYDAYTNRTFTITDGEVSAYTGTHWLDSGRNEPGPGDPIPNGLVPYIRLYPYADTTNPGGVYIMAICYIGDGSAYPVEPRDCKYDAFKVKKQMTISFFLEGMKFLDVDGDGTSNGYTEPGLEGWKIIISGTGPDGLPLNAVEYTDATGYWSYSSPEYKFSGSQKPVDVSLTICEELQSGWTQTYPGGSGCHTLTFTPTGFDSYFGLDFGNGKPAIDVEKTCTAVVPVGTPIDYDLDVKNTGNVNLVNVDVKDATLGFDNDPNLSLIPGGTGHYDLTITPTTPQVIKNTVKATGDYGLTTVFATVSDSDTCTTNVVDARISIKESDTNGITEPHTFTVTVEKNDGSGWVPAKDVIVTVTETGVGDVTSETCTAGTDVNGQCTVTVNSKVPGSSTVNASATVNVLGVDIKVATDGYGAYIVSNVKTWVAGSLVWYKYDNAGNLLGGATFEVCRTYDRFGVDIPDECVTVLDNAFPDADPDSGEFKLINLLLGRYTITETVPPVGFEGDAFVETLELTLEKPNGVATHVWVNIPYQGCTPGFWQGGNDLGTAGGKWLWNDPPPDPQWGLSGGMGTNPYYWDTDFCTFFSCGNSGTMWYYVNPDMWGQNDDFHKAARSLTAAYLNASWGMNYPYDTTELMTMWANALVDGKLLELHNKLDLANNAYYRNGGGDHCPISASGY